MACATAKQEIDERETIPASRYVFPCTTRRLLRQRQNAGTGPLDRTSPLSAIPLESHPRFYGLGARAARGVARPFGSRIGKSAMSSPSFWSLLITLAVLFATSPSTAQTLGRPARPTQTAGQTPLQTAPSRPVSNVRLAPPPSPAPFQLNPQQRALLDQILNQWETESAKIQTFRCGFERWEYDPVFLQDGDRIPVATSTGQLKYARPDKGMFRITEIRRYDAKKKDYEKAEKHYSMAAKKGNLEAFLYINSCCIFNSLVSPFNFTVRVFLC